MQFGSHTLSKTPDQLDQKLVVRVQKGDRTAFDLLLVKYQNRVASIVSRFLNNPEDIADATQEIFIKAYRAIHQFRGDSTFYTWLFRIAINHAKSVLRKYKPKTLDGESCGKNELGNNAHFINVETPENIFSQTELAMRIERALSIMPPDLSVALMLREFDGLSYAEISHVMDCPIGTVRSRIFRARERLEQALSHTIDTSL